MVNNVIPTDDNLVNLDIKIGENGDHSITSKRWRRGEGSSDNMVDWQMKEVPFSQLKTVARLQDVKMVDFEKEATTYANGVGKVAKEVKAGGGTKTEQIQKIQPAWIETKERWLNKYEASPKNFADAYISYVDIPAIFVDADATQGERRQLAKAEGVDLKDANFIEVKNGVPQFTKAQIKDGREALGKIFDTKADEIVSLNLGSTQNNTFNRLIGT